MKKSVFILFLSLCIVSVGFGQTYRYSIISKGQKVGLLTATKIKGGATSVQERSADAPEPSPAEKLGKDEEMIKVRSDFDVHLFIKVHVKYDMTCEYDQGELVKYSVETFKDGDLHSSSKGSKEGEMYRTVDDGEEATHEGGIYYSGAMLYFKEPKGISTVFSEIHAKDKPLKELGKGHYEITDPSTGHRNQYFYRNGVLIKAIIDHSLFSFSMVLE